MVRVVVAGRLVAAVASVALLGGAVVGCGSGGPGEGKAVTASEVPVRTSPIAGQLAGLPAAVDGAKIVVGKPDAPRTAQVLVDPKCVHCARFEEAGGESLLKLAAAGQVRIEYLLASFLDRDGASGSVKAVNALRASADAGKFAEFHAAVFASQPKGRFTDELLLRIADRVPGLRGAEFDAAVKDRTYEGWVAEAQKGFEATGAQGTPMVLVEGAPVGSRDGSLFDAGAFARALRGVGIGSSF
ncbi:thioredoxin domain-containing protein [Streptomyces sp. ZAF1911]|uniref:DsbA family protein n=1 Tax=Streptomyces sp. ZAF1911 TaxID=2944129 RepID=UPI00237ACDA9|nr:thioredoxin domain-containing protein [Streptomyces sp. ZAF1911]MDD9377239.1 thioredoxin domain-containing protein [Streptomyces sp. ZAF1911]